MKEATNVNTGDVIQVQNASYEVLQVVPDAVYMFEEYGITAALVQRKKHFLHGCSISLLSCGWKAL